MKEKVKEILSNNTFSLEDSADAIMELGEEPSKMLEILEEIKQEKQEVFLLSVYKHIYSDAILFKKTDEELLNELIDKLKKRLKTTKSFSILNYVIVANIAITCIRGGYSLLISKILGIITLLLCAFNHYSYTKKISKEGSFLNDLLRIRELLPKLRMIVENENCREIE